MFLKKAMGMFLKLIKEGKKDIKKIKNITDFSYLLINMIVTLGVGGRHRLNE